MLHEQITNIRALFVTDQETRDSFSRIPTHKDIFTAVANSLCNNREVLHLSRKRIRLGIPMMNARQTVIGYVGISLVRNAIPTKHEHERVWGKIRHDNVSGIFIRHMIVHKDERCQGFGSILLDAIRAKARGMELSVYFDVTGSNIRMRKFLHTEGGSPSIFWQTKKGALMVRYRFH